MKRFALLIFIASPAMGASYGYDWYNMTVSELLAMAGGCSPAKIYGVKDGLTSQDVATGGGTESVAAQCNNAGTGFEALANATDAVMDGDAAGGSLGGTYPNPTVMPSCSAFEAVSATGSDLACRDYILLNATDVSITTPVFEVNQWGNVGIHTGVAGPTAELHLRSPSTSSASFDIDPNASTGVESVAIMTLARAGTDRWWVQNSGDRGAGRVDHLEFGNATDFSTPLQLYPGGKAQINGSVGAAPTEVLTVNGNIAVTGTVDGWDLSADGTNCSANQAALGIDNQGNAQGCWTPVQGHGDGANCAANESPLGVDAAGAVQGCRRTAGQASDFTASRLVYSDAASSLTGTNIVWSSNSLSAIVNLSGTGNVDFEGTTHDLEGNLQVDTLSYESTVPTGSLYTKDACFQTSSPAGLGECTSMEEFKRRVRALQGAEEVLAALRPVTFRMAGTKETRAGFLAGDHSRAFWRAGIVVPETQIDRNAVLAVLVRVVQDQQQKIAELQEAVAVLFEEVDRLKER